MSEGKGFESRALVLCENLVKGSQGYAETIKMVREAFWMGYRERDTEVRTLKAAFEEAKEKAWKYDQLSK